MAEASGSAKDDRSDRMANVAIAARSDGRGRGERIEQSCSLLLRRSSGGCCGRCSRHSRRSLRVHMQRGPPNRIVSRFPDRLERQIIPLSRALLVSESVSCAHLFAELLDWRRLAVPREDTHGGHDAREQNKGRIQDTTDEVRIARHRGGAAELAAAAAVEEERRSEGACGVCWSVGGEWKDCAHTRSS